MAGKKNDQKQSYWLDLMVRQASSGLSIRQFCAEERVSEPSFYAWRRKLAERRTDARSRASSGGQAAPQEGPAFIPLKLLEAAGAVEVIHPLGYRVRVTGEVNAAELRRVLDVLDERSER